MREITIATVQMKPELGQMEDNLVKMSDFIARIAAEQPVDLIVFRNWPRPGTRSGHASPNWPSVSQAPRST